MTDAVLTKTQFASVPAWVARNAEIVAHPTSLVVYAHLCLLGDFKTRVTTSDWPEVTTSTGLSKPTVMRAMKVLRKVGAIVRYKAELRLPMDDPASLTSDTESPAPVSDLIQPSLTSDTDTLLTEIYSDPERGFSDVWDAYPRHKNPNRKATLAKYLATLKRCRDATPELLALAAENYAISREGEDWTFTKHAPTFFGPDEWWRGYLETAEPEPQTTYRPAITFPDFP